MSDLELAKKVDELDLICLNLKSITCFLIVPTITNMSNLIRYNVDSIVIFLKSLIQY